MSDEPDVGGDAPTPDPTPEPDAATAPADIDDIFAAAAGTPPPVESGPFTVPPIAHDHPSDDAPGNDAPDEDPHVDDLPIDDVPDWVSEATPITDAAPGTSVYPDPDAVPLHPVQTGTARAWGTPRLPPATGARFERRVHPVDPLVDDEGLYPQDYYLATDWPSVLTKGFVALVVITALAIAGFEFYDRYAERVDDVDTRQPTATPVAEIPVYVCAGDEEPFATIGAPDSALIAGRTADSRWLAFRNPTAPPRQLWVRASDVPTFAPASVGIVSCASGPEEFPTPFGAN